MLKIKQIGVLASFITMLAITLSLNGPVNASTPTTTNTIDRNLEPVVIVGTQIPFFWGESINEIFVYTYTNGSFGGQIPFQIDERSDEDVFVALEDNLFDANDEIVFMAHDIGDQAPDGSLPPALQASNLIYEVEVSDPLAPSKTGWVYIVHGPTLTPSFSGDYVDYDPGTQRITSNQYELGFSGNHAGLDYLAINNSGVDVLDRGKIRIVSDLSGLLTQMVTENLFNQITPSEIKDGPIRVIVQQKYEAVGSTLTTTHVGYNHTLEGIADLTLADLPGTTITQLRTSMDFNSNAVGGTFYNANTQNGVPLDGTPDPGIADSLSNWFQITLPSGRYIQVTDPSPMGPDPQSYHEDDSSVGNDTGDGQSFGEFGYIVTDTVDLSPSSSSAFYILPPTVAPQIDNVGTQYESFFFNRLQVSANLIDGTAGIGSIQIWHIPLIISQEPNIIVIPR
ncbi:MAG: hypothetical protein AAF485_01505 [Chloroflexota bacterium]